ncbi:hypothetical protein ACLQ2R_07340 [Streptosporangium sp. DT93]|uniref:hypothetical protein n=1 Tax=Streptosporangium sp. DT93 TaxID=3393428 RepID=UPI003CE97F40
MREFASIGALRIMVSAVAVLGCLGLAAVTGSIADRPAADGVTATVALGGNTPWGIAGKAPGSLDGANTPWGIAGKAPETLDGGNTPWG